MRRTIFRLTLACVPALVPAELAAQEPLVVAGLQLDDPVEFGRVTDVVRVPAGYLVADGQVQELVLIGPDGRVAGVFGGEGDGPGEYAQIGGLQVDGDRVVVHDSRSRRLTILSMTGEVIRTVRLSTEGTDELDGYSLDRLMGVLPGGGYLLSGIALGPSAGSATTIDRIAYIYFNEEGEFVQVAARSTGFYRARVDGSTCGFGSGPHPMTPYPHAALRIGTLYYVAPDHRTIVELDLNSGAEREIQLPFVARDESVMWEEFDGAWDEHETGERWRQFARCVEALPENPPLPLISGLIAAEDGVWVRGFRPALDALAISGPRGGGGGAWVRLGGGGEIRVPDGLVLIRIQDGELIGRQVGEFDQEGLVVYREPGTGR